jgi:uncharacterized iron-regulated membrane protein
MILVIIFTLAALTIAGAIIYGVQQKKKTSQSPVAQEAEVQQPAPEPKQEVKAAPASKPAKMSAKQKKSTPKVTKTK